MKSFFGWVFLGVGRFFVGRWRRFDFQKIMMHLDVRMFFLGVGAPDGGTPKRWIKISHSLRRKNPVKRPMNLRKLSQISEKRPMFFPPIFFRACTQKKKHCRFSWARIFGAATTIPSAPRVLLLPLQWWSMHYPRPLLELWVLNPFACTPLWSYQSCPRNARLAPPGLKRRHRLRGEVATEWHDDHPNKKMLGVCLCYSLFKSFRKKKPTLTDATSNHRSKSLPLQSK